MIIKYLEALKELFTNMKSRGGDFSFADFLSIIGLSISLALICAVIIALIIGLTGGPFKVYGKFIKGLRTERNKLISDHTVFDAGIEERLAILNKKIRNRTFMYIIGVVVIYVPVALPTLLYLCYLVFHM